MNAQVDEIDLKAAVEAPVEVAKEVIEPTWTEDEAHEAEAMGWIPPERAKKLPEGKEYVGPVEYMERNPLYKQMKELKSSFSELNNHYQKVSEIEHKKAEKEFDQKIADLKAEKVKALDEANHSRVVDIDEEIRNVEKPETANSDNDPEFKAWIGENKWYEEDSFLNVEANIIGERLSQTMRGTELLNAVKSHLKEKYPAKFSNPARSKPSAVEGGTARPSSSKGVTESDLTADERTIYNNFSSMGVFSEKGSAQKYLNEVMALRD